MNINFKYDFIKTDSMRTEFISEGNFVTAVKLKFDNDYEIHIKKIDILYQLDSKLDNTVHIIIFELVAALIFLFTEQFNYSNTVLFLDKLLSYLCNKKNINELLNMNHDELLNSNVVTLFK